MNQGPAQYPHKKKSIEISECSTQILRREEMALAKASVRRVGARPQVQRRRASVQQARMRGRTGGHTARHARERRRMQRKKGRQGELSYSHSIFGARRAGLFGLGAPELAVVGGVAALLFGPSKLPEIGRSVGKSVRGFQSAAEEFEEELKAGKDEADAEAAAARDENAGTGSDSAPAQKEEQEQPAKPRE